MKDLAFRRSLLSKGAKTGSLGENSGGLGVWLRKRTRREGSSLREEAARRPLQHCNTKDVTGGAVFSAKSMVELIRYIDAMGMHRERACYSDISFRMMTS